MTKNVSISLVNEKNSKTQWEYRKDFFRMEVEINHCTGLIRILNLVNYLVIANALT